MNLDDLKALIRLANNNPNPNEANAAARRVCKILAKDDFSLLQSQPVYSTAAGKVNYKPTEAQQKAKWTQPPTGPGFDASEFFRNWKRPEWQGFDWAKAPHQNAPEPDWIPPEYKTKNERVQEKRKCVKCGWETMTFRVNEVPFICNPCNWKEKT